MEGYHVYNNFIAKFRGSLPPDLMLELVLRCTGNQ